MIRSPIRPASDECDTLSKDLRHRHYFDQLDADDSVRKHVLYGSYAPVPRPRPAELGSEEVPTGAVRPRAQTAYWVKRAIRSKPVITVSTGVATAWMLRSPLAFAPDGSAPTASRYPPAGRADRADIHRLCSGLHERLPALDAGAAAGTRRRNGRALGALRPRGRAQEEALIANTLAADMASIDPAFLASIQGVIDDGYADTFAKGLRSCHHFSRRTVRITRGSRAYGAQQCRQRGLNHGLQRKHVFSLIAIGWSRFRKSMGAHLYASPPQTTESPARSCLPIRWRAGPRGPSGT